MNAEELKAIETQRQALLGQLTAAETALRTGLHASRGFGEIARAHMERARAHIQEAFIAINEAKSVRSVQQLVDDLTRIQQVMGNTRHGRSQRI